jgi:undecaprenyl-diphosphatase
MPDFFKQLDFTLFALINTGLKSPLNDWWLGYATWLGDGVVLTPIALVFLFWFDRRHFFRNVIFILLCCLVGGLMIQVIKSYVPRERPLWSADLQAAGIMVNVMLEPLHSRSFPSGHTQTAFGFATAVALQYPTAKRTLAVSFILAALVGTSRVYVGAHFPSDVLAGCFAGVLSSLGVATVLMRYKFFQRSTPPALA